MEKSKRVIGPNGKHFVNLVDTNFVGRDLMNLSMCKFNWTTANQLVSDYVFFTDTQLDKVKKLRNVDVKKVAWLLEPKGISPDIYDWIYENHKLFDHVLTFDKEMVEKLDNALYQPYGTFWLSKLEVPIKHRGTSMIASWKKDAPGHKLRHQIYDKYKLSPPEEIEFFGTITGTYINSKCEGLDKFNFSIAVENCIQDGYFSEKLLDCFATKTIPIYWGSRHVSDFFNTDGIIFFDTLEELEEILPTLNQELYDSKKEAIMDNYERIDAFHLPELYMEKHYPDFVK